MRLTLDDIEAERGEVEPFELVLGDHVVTLPPPDDLPADLLLKDFAADATGAVAVLKLMLGDDAFDELLAAERPDGRKRVTLGVMRVIVEKYYAHYGLGSPGEDGASPVFLNRSARRSKRTSPVRATA